jgi:hypothetical protein
MFGKLVKRIRASFYDKLTIREEGEPSEFLGEIFTNCIPRIGEDIKVADQYIYKIVDIIYNLEWDRIGSVDILVRKK